MSRPYDIPLEPDPVIEAYKQHVDRSLLRENLRRTPEERLLALMELQRFAAELQRAGRAAKAPVDDRLSCGAGRLSATPACSSSSSVVLPPRSTAPLG